MPQKPRSDRPAKTLLTNMLLAFLTTALCLAAAEGFLRAFRPQVQDLNSDIGLWIPDPELGRRLKPGMTGRIRVLNTFDTEVRINSAGLRSSREIHPFPALGRPRVLFLGDSFVFGWGVEEDQTLPAQLESALKAQGVTSEVINAGVYAFDTGHYVLWNRRLMSYGPTVTIVGFCLENDLYLSAPAPAAVEAPVVHAAPASKPAPTLSSAYHWIKENVLIRSHLLALVRDQLYIRFPDIRKYLFALGVNEKRQIFLKEYPADLGAQVLRVRDNLRTLRDEVRAEGGHLLIVAIPMREQVYSGEQIDRFPGFDSQRPGQVLADLCDELDILLVDLLPVFKRLKGSSAERFYYETDPHFTPHGNRVAAEALVDTVRRYL